MFKRKRDSRDIPQDMDKYCKRGQRRMWDVGCPLADPRRGLKVQILTLKTRPRPAPLKVHRGQHDEGTLDSHGPASLVSTDGETMRKESHGPASLISTDGETMRKTVTDQHPS